MGNAKPKQIFAFSGVLGDVDARARNFQLSEYAIGLAHVRNRPVRACYLPTAMGDAAEAISSKRAQFARLRPDIDFSVLTLFTQPNVSDVEAYLLSQDVILVEGGSVVNLMAIWRAHDLPAVLRRCWDAGVVLSGASAGSLCWHQGGPTDSWGDDLAPFTDGLGFLPFSNNVHDDLADQPRHRTYRELIANGTLNPGYATPGGVGLHYIDRTLHEAVSIRADAQACFVTQAPGGAQDTPVSTRVLRSVR